MAIRLKHMRRILKDTGSIYLHCDPTASHYLKMIMDIVFGNDNFRNEIIWVYGLGGSSKSRFSKKHDVILFYSKSGNYYFDKPQVPATSQMLQGKMKGMLDTWTDIPSLNNMAKERLGYPTQKPNALLERIIKSSSNEGDIVLDPFCGCGTTVHAAELINRKWIGIDISQFSAGLVRNRIINSFEHKQFSRTDINIIGCPLRLVDAQDLARNDPFEFEKWACGEVGAQGLFHNPGDRGRDGGVDGVIPFHYSKDLFDGKPPEKTFAVVQVKGGKVTPDSVKALSTTVRESGGKCGIMICFEKYMNTVENNREKKLIKEMSRDFNFIQGLSIENLIEGKRPYLPLQGYAA